MIKILLFVLLSIFFAIPLGKKAYICLDIMLTEDNLLNIIYLLMVSQNK